MPSTESREADWAGAFRTVEREHGFEPCRVEGVFPLELYGTLYRNGPGVFERFGERYPHWFDADGVTTAVRVTASSVDCAVRIVETRGRARERDGVSYPDIATLDRFVKPLGHGIEDRSFGSTLTRYVVDLRTKRGRAEVIFREPHELPQVAPAVVGSENRFTYVVGYSPERADGRGLWDSVLKIDGRTGAVERFTPGDGQYPGEALFVARSGASDEDDGYLLTHVLDAKQGVSREVVLDARRIGDGPIASAAFPNPVPARLHGAFAAA